MESHSTHEVQRDQSPLSTASHSQGAKLSPREVLESMSNLRINKGRIKPLETRSWARGRNADLMLAQLVPTGASEPLRSVGVQHVAVKKLALDGEKYDTRVPGSLASELCLLKSLSHENIVKPIGFVEDAKDVISWIILPWENNGNLREFLQSADWEFQERVALIYDVAKGIDYLHGREPPICHGNLKCLNVILNPKNKAVITDFGSARSVGSTSRDISQFQEPSAEAERHSNAEPPKIKVAASGEIITLTGPKWVLSWAAPELQGRGLSDRTSDIWAFGWICWEVLTSDFPLNGENEISLGLHTVEGKLPQGQGDGRRDHVIALANLMVKCWSLDPSKRPTAKVCESQVYPMERKTPCNRNGSGSPEIRSSRLLTARAFEQASHGSLEEAVELLTRATNIARSTKDGLAIAHAAHMLGAVYRSQRKYSKAEESYVAARDIYARVGNQDSLAGATHGLGEVYCLQDKYSKAEEVYIETRDIYTRIGDRLGLANAVYGLGEAYRLRGESSKAEESYLAARDMYAEIGERLSHANTVRALGEVYRLRGESSKAIECYIAARDIYAQSGDQVGLARTTKALGDVHYLRGEYPTAEESYVNARDIYAGIKNQLGLATAVKALGDVYRFRGESSKAEESYLTARKVNTEMGNQLGLANAIRALGDIYRLQGESSKAEESYITARDIYTQLGDQNGLANTMTALGQLYAKQDDHTRAEQLYQEAQSIYTKIGSRYSLANNLLYTGWLYRDQKRYGDAEVMVSKALPIFEELGLETYRLDCEEFLTVVRQKKTKSWKVVLKAFLP